MSNIKTEVSALETAKLAYANARLSLAASIKANQSAMRAFRSAPSEDTKSAYTASRAEHKAQLANIRNVRKAFYKLQDAE